MPEPIDVNDLTLGADSSSEPTEISEFGNQFLTGVEETDREIVAKYIKDWDGKVTQEFQKRAEALQPWESLGEPIDRVQQAINILRSAEADPVEFYKYIKGTLTEMEYDLSDEQSPVGVPDTSPLPEYDGLPESFVGEFKQMKEALNGISEFVNSQQQVTKEQEQQQQVDQLLTSLHDEHGDFDDDAVLGRILKGMDPEDAVKDSLDYIKKAINTQKTKRQSPPTLGGEGQTVREQVDASKLKDKRARVGHVADLLTSALQND